MGCLSDLKKRLKKAKRSEKKAYKNVLAKCTDENINLLNNKRMDVKIIQQKIKNTIKKPNVGDSFPVPKALRGQNI